MERAALTQHPGLNGIPAANSSRVGTHHLHSTPGANHILSLESFPFRRNTPQQLFTPILCLRNTVRRLFCLVKDSRIALVITSRFPPLCAASITLGKPFRRQRAVSYPEAHKIIYYDIHELCGRSLAWT